LGKQGKTPFSFLNAHLHQELDSVFIVYVGQEINFHSFFLSFWVCLKAKKEAYQLWKCSKIPIEDHQNLARACRDAVRS